MADQKVERDLPAELQIFFICHDAEIQADATNCQISKSLLEPISDTIYLTKSKRYRKKSSSLLKQLKYDKTE